MLDISNGHTKFQSRPMNLDLGLTLPKIKLLRVIFIYFNVLKFHVPRSMFLSYHAKTHIEAHTYGGTHRL